MLNVAEPSPFFFPSYSLRQRQELHVDVENLPEQDERHMQTRSWSSLEKLPAVTCERDLLNPASWQLKGGTGSQQDEHLASYNCVRRSEMDDGGWSSYAGVVSYVKPFRKVLSINLCALNVYRRVWMGSIACVYSGELE